MTCTFEQADFGPPFDEMDPAEFEMFLETAIAIVLGPEECQAETEAKWLACCADPCLAIKLVTKHIISTDPGADVGDKDAKSERVGDVAVSYADISTGDNPFSDTTYGRQFGLLLRKYIRCSSRRMSMPTALRTNRGCGCGSRGRRRR